MNWSHYQRDIFSAFEHGGDSLLIEAVAGSGKTRTLEELARIMGEKMPGLRGIMVAFNKSIAVELQSRIDKYGFRNVQAMTLHSAGWVAWRRAGGLDWEPTVDNSKIHKIMREVLSYEENKRFGETTRKLVGYARGIGLVPRVLPNSMMHDKSDFGLVYNGLVEDEAGVWESLMDHYSLAEDECSVDCARRVLARSIELAQESCDFDDMLYMPVVAGVPFDRYDVVLVDEAQDVSAIQRTMIERMVDTRKVCVDCGCPVTERMQEFSLDCPCGCNCNNYKQGRVIACGDRKQAIFGFRGAGTNSMDELKEHFRMRELPLSVSYRCPVAVVQHARQWVPQIEWREGAEDGIVFLEDHDHARQAEIALDGISKWRGIQDFQPGDAILCRLTRPLVAAAFTLIRARVAGVHVLGRDIGGGLVAIVKKAKSLQAGTVAEFDRWLEDYEHREGERLTGKGKHAQAGLLGDKADTIRVFMSQLGEDATVPELIREIERMFVDANGGTARMITLATVHKAKGLEWERVFVLDAGEFMPCPWARGNACWEMQQERNLMYVAATRAMRELRYITTGDLR